MPNRVNAVTVVPLRERDHVAKTAVVIRPDESVLGVVRRAEVLRRLIHFDRGVIGGVIPQLPVYVAGWVRFIADQSGGNPSLAQRVVYRPPLDDRIRR